MEWLLGLLCALAAGAMGFAAAGRAADRRRGQAESELARLARQRIEEDRIARAEAAIDAETAEELRRISAEHPTIERPTEADALELLERARKARKP